MREDALVQPLHERETDAAPGPFYVVKGQCLICALHWRPHPAISVGAS